MTHVVVVRHGNTFGPGEPARRIGARTDPPLVDSGREQAVALAAWFANRGVCFGEVLSSPSKRCLETARLIAPAVPAVATEWLQEIDHGPDEDLPEQDVVGRIGRAALERWDAEGHPPDGWIADREARVKAWRRFFREVWTPTLLVTSNGAARFALIALGVESRPAGMKLRTGAMGEFAVRGGRTTLVSWNVRPGQTEPGLIAEQG